MPKTEAADDRAGKLTPAASETLSARERSLHDRERAIEAREESAGLRERDEAATHVVQRESAVLAREDAVLTREESARLREMAVAAQEEAVQAKSKLEELMVQMRDVNERLVVATVQAQTMTDEAERANRLKDEFLATVSHELRTPLNAVLGWARMLAAKQVEGERAAHALTTVERNAALLARIIDDLLDVSRAMTGTLQMASQPVNVVEVVEAALDSVESLAGERFIKIQLSSDDSATEPVSGDATRLQQVIWNLLANAIKFTPERGRVAVSVTRVGTEIEIAISDMGQGISQEFLPYVFDRFRQAQGGTTRRHSGVGLGLAIAREIVEQHGGTVRAESPGLGKGSTFTIRLPILAPLTAEERPRPPAPPSHDIQRLDGLRILVVEDDADGLELLSFVLESAGANVTAVVSVEAAFQALDGTHPDALVSDIGLPDEDGYALIRRLRQREAQQGGFLPAVALTGYTTADDRARVLAAGFQAHVPKPVEPVALTAAITAVSAIPPHKDLPPDD
jgi:signal transduction histidine kinase/ActR/RegA family two-component response regulator